MTTFVKQEIEANMQRYLDFAKLYEIIFYMVVVGMESLRFWQAVSQNIVTSSGSRSIWMLHIFLLPENQLLMPWIFYLKNTICNHVPYWWAFIMGCLLTLQEKALNATREFELRLICFYQNRRSSMVLIVRIISIFWLRKLLKTSVRRR